MNEQHETSQAICQASTLWAKPDFRPMVERFVAQLPEQIEHLRQAIEEKDQPAIEQSMHNLKGALGLYGYAALLPPVDLSATADAEIETVALVNQSESFLATLEGMLAQESAKVA